MPLSEQIRSLLPLFKVYMYDGSITNDMVRGRADITLENSVYYPLQEVKIVDLDSFNVDGYDDHEELDYH